MTPEAGIREQVLQAAAEAYIDARHERLPDAECSHRRTLAAARAALTLAKERLDLLRKQWHEDARGSEALNQAGAELRYLFAALSDASRPQGQEQKEDGAVLIGQTIPTGAETEPHPALGPGRYGTCEGHPRLVECEYCHSMVTPRDPYHVHGYNECLCGVKPTHNQYLHDRQGVTNGEE